MSNELKATPGDWKQVTGIGYCAIRTGDMESKTGGVIADMRFVDGYYNPFDACILAAAKDLLESLEYAVKQVPELADVPGIKRSLAKARGETQ